MAANFTFLVGGAGCHGLQVGARTEIASGSSKDRDRCLAIGIERVEGVEQFLRRCTVYGITAMRTVARNDGHRTIALDKHAIRVGHGYAPGYEMTGSTSDWLKSSALRP